MEVKPGYKQTEMGVIPSDWDIQQLGLVAAITTGRKDVNEGNPVGEYPFFTCSRTRTFSDSYSFDTEAILIAGNGDVGNLHYYFGKFEAYQRTYVVSRFTLDVRYLWHQLEYRLVESLGLGKIGTSIPYIKKENLTGFTFPLPPTEAEQRAIAAALSDVDALLGGLDRLIAKKRDLKQAAMQQLLTGQTRLPGFSGAWEVKRLGDVGSTYGGLTGKTKADFGIGTGRYVTFMNVMTNVVIDCASFEQVRVTPSESQNRVNEGDLLFNGSSETPEEVAMCSFMASDVPNLFLNSFCFGFRRRDEQQTDGLFLAYYLRANPGRELMKSLAQGSTRYNLSKGALLDASIQLPLKAEQTAIAAVLSDMDAELAALEARRDKTRDLKQAMMQELLTGRTRLV